MANGEPIPQPASPPETTFFAPEAEGPDPPESNERHPMSRKREEMADLPPLQPWEATREVFPR